MRCSKSLIIFIVLLLTLPLNLYPQLLNGSFEEWNELGNPNYWNTNSIFGFSRPIVPSEDAQDGSLSAKIEMVEVSGAPFSGNLQSIDTTYFFGHTISERYSSLTGYYKFIPISSCQLIMTIGVYNESAMLIGVGGLNLWKSVENWTQFNIPIQYLMENQPATTIISISLIDTSDSGTNLDVLGSTAFIDNLVLGDPTNISDNMSNRLSFKLNQNYPNPFNPVTKIKFTIPDGDVNNQYVNLNVFDILGRKIASLINGKKNPGSYEVIFNGSNYPSGIYFYELRYGEMKSVRKMILTK